MGELTVKGEGALEVPSEETLRRIEAFEAKCLALPREKQVEPEITHCLHGGMYARTVRIPAGTIGVGAIVIVPTIVILDGHCFFNSGDHFKEFRGHHVMAGIPGRKQVVYTITETYITAVFPTNARTVEEAEAEATSEPEKLSTRRYRNELVGNGDRRSAGGSGSGGELLRDEQAEQESE